MCNLPYPNYGRCDVSEWIETTVGEYIPFTYGKNLPKTMRKSGNVNVYGSNGTVDNHEEAFVNSAGLIIGRKGSVGAVHLSKKPFWPIDTAFFIQKDDVNELLYDYYLLRSLSLEKMNSDSAVPGLNRDNAHALKIKIPNKKEHRIAIGKWISTLDDKIENNRRTNETLEEMAQAIFKSWFVDFDPVHAKIDALKNGGSDEDARIAAMCAISGKTLDALHQLKTQNPGDYAQLARTADAFPSAFTDSPLGPIPKGWEVTTLSEVSNCFDNKRIPLSKRQREERPGNIPYYGATSVMDYVDEPIFNGIYLLLGEDGSVLKENGTPFTQYIWGKSWINNHAHVLQGTHGISTEHLLTFINQTNITAYITGAVQLKLNQRNMNSIPFLKAHQTINQSFDIIIQALFGAYRNYSEENQFLTETRDALLPKLLSGEIDVDTGINLKEGI